MEFRSDGMGMRKLLLLIPVMGFLSSVKQIKENNSVSLASLISPPKTLLHFETPSMTRFS
ncbi:hypothetical protein ZOD2009_19083 [Haladaptatus paucihalophilus DX253]|uniref:Uncharacterized protein n=1 Tax=Haladaptatus paucihalophilus DX253 TaxID=797209 RepID=E7QYC6_HALPU|nr:hypothetical protein ZOD2009_19083 [Haladaptatus paucihalophilus DX253]